MYRTIIGLEIHAELQTESKIFCGCSTTYGGDTNTQVCPVCLGLPGSLPVVNERVIDFAIKTGLAFDAEITRHSKMDRKNYFYPDLVKAYQISQYDKPLCTDGHVIIETGDEKKEVRIQRIHIEEDTGKSFHSEDGSSLLDYNRSGVPLIEIVTHPDMASGEEATAFLDQLKGILEYIEVSDVKMEQGSLRCDVNINVVDDERGLVSKIAEVKNLNSFKAVASAIEYEAKRHQLLLEEGKNTNKETRRWNDQIGETVFMRSKEHVQDYRYFPEPDIVDFEIDDAWIEGVRATIPELPLAKKERFVSVYELPDYDAGVLVSDRALAAYFETVVERVGDAKLVSNWIMTELLRRMKDEETSFDALKFGIEDFERLLEMVKENTVSTSAAKKIFRGMFEQGEKPDELLESLGLKQISDEDALGKLVDEVLEQNPQSIEDYRSGKGRALGFLVGQVMKASRGKANPQMVNELLRERLDG